MTSCTYEHHLQSSVAVLSQPSSVQHRHVYRHTTSKIKFILTQLKYNYNNIGMLNIQNNCTNMNVENYFSFRYHMQILLNQKLLYLKQFLVNYIRYQLLMINVIYKGVNIGLWRVQICIWPS